MDRVEFLAALVHVAIAKYVSPAIITDVSDSLAKLISVDIAARLEASGSVFAESNAFRVERCYIEEVDGSLRRHEKALRSIFHGLQVEGLASPTSRWPSLGQVIDLSTWMDFLRSLELFDVDVAEREGQMAFAAARMMVVDGEKDKGQAKDTHLNFEGFLEALCRLSVLKALPTDVEIAKADMADAGEYLRHLKANDPAAYAHLLKSRGSAWPGEPTLQPMGRCVEHLIRLIIATIAADDHLAKTLLPRKKVSSK